jgi:uncharacterized membrane protein YhaH (DUF805 family)
MNFGEAIASGFSNYVNFSSRAARSEYWYWVLFNVLAQVVTEIIDNAVIGMSVTTAIFLSRRTPAGHRCGGPPAA